MKTLIRAELQTRDEGIVTGNTTKKHNKFIEHINNYLIENNTEPDHIQLFFQTQAAIEPETYNDWPQYKKFDMNIPMVISHIAIKFPDTTNETTIENILNNMHTDEHLTTYNGLAWKKFNPETDMP